MGSSWFYAQHRWQKRKSSDRRKLPRAPVRGATPERRVSPGPPIGTRGGPDIRERRAGVEVEERMDALLELRPIRSVVD